ncbi:hypothetical protein BV20DRAFT_1055128 [Pilatotrama ljubarskyi]|nr:hypothetical protein BV20DRAFT_1055128 [Pilatotrama ljubarskyi]
MSPPSVYYVPVHIDGTIHLAGHADIRSLWTYEHEPDGELLQSNVMVWDVAMTEWCPRSLLEAWTIASEGPPTVLVKTMEIGVTMGLGDELAQLEAARPACTHNGTPAVAMGLTPEADDTDRDSEPPARRAKSPTVRDWADRPAVEKPVWSLPAIAPYAATEGANPESLGHGAAPEAPGIEKVATTGRPQEGKRDVFGGEGMKLTEEQKSSCTLHSSTTLRRRKREDEEGPPGKRGPVSLAQVMPVQIPVTWRLYNMPPIRGGSRRESPSKRRAKYSEELKNLCHKGSLERMPNVTSCPICSGKVFAQVLYKRGWAGAWQFVCTTTRPGSRAHLYTPMQPGPPDPQLMEIETLRDALEVGDAGSDGGHSEGPGADAAIQRQIAEDAALARHLAEEEEGGRPPQSNMPFRNAANTDFAGRAACAQGGPSRCVDDDAMGRAWNEPNIPNLVSGEEGMAVDAPSEGDDNDDLVEVDADGDRVIEIDDDRAPDAVHAAEEFAEGSGDEVDTEDEDDRYARLAYGIEKKDIPEMRHRLDPYRLVLEVRDPIEDIITDQGLGIVIVFLWLKTRTSPTVLRLTLRRDGKLHLADYPVFRYDTTERTPGYDFWEEGIDDWLPVLAGTIEVARDLRALVIRENSVRTCADLGKVLNAIHINAWDHGFMQHHAYMFAFGRAKKIMARRRTPDRVHVVFWGSDFVPPIMWTHLLPEDRILPAHLLWPPELQCRADAPLEVWHTGRSEWREVARGESLKVSMHAHTLLVRLPDTEHLSTFGVELEGLSLPMDK